MKHRTGLQRLLLLFAAFAAAPALAVEPLYNITDLGERDWFVGFNATAINNTGLVSGYGPDSYGTRHATVWNNGVKTDLNSGSAITTYAYGINDQSKVVGQFNTTYQGSFWHASLWQNGAMTDLGTLGGLSNSLATDINNNNQVTGTAYNGSLDYYNTARRGVLWSNGVITDLGTLGGTLSSGDDINDLGQIVGSSATQDGSSHAFIWSNGTMTDLGTLGGAASSAAGINNYGQVVGTSQILDGTSHAFVWNNGVMTDIGNSGMWYSSSAYAINDNGQVIGTAGAYGDYSRAFLWDNGVMQDITFAIPTASGVRITGAYDINNSGQILATGFYYSTGMHHSFLLTPVVTTVPIPNALWLFGSGLLGLIGISRRWKISKG